MVDVFVDELDMGALGFKGIDPAATGRLAPDFNTITDFRKDNGKAIRSVCRHHLVIAHEVTNVGNDRMQLSKMANQAREEIGAESLTVVADRGYYKPEATIRVPRVKRAYKFVEEKYFTSGDFNGLKLHELLSRLDLSKDEVLAEIRIGIETDVFTIEHLGNPHIKSFADVKEDEMLAFLDESKGEAI